jgi:uncharacterized integral membrane protein
MRYVYAALIIAITTIVLLFKIQNLSLVTVSLLNMSLTLPSSLLIVGVYVLGMFTGSALWSLLRGWLQAAMRKPE